MKGSFACWVNRASRLNKTLHSLPVHCLTAEDLRSENAKGIMQHFHSPENSHNRFLASSTQQERAILRHIERPAEYKHAAREAGWNNRVRPSSAPVQQRAVGLNANSNTRSTAGSLQQQQQQQHPHAAHDARQHHKQQVSSSSTTTQKGVPCCSVSMLMDVDLMTGQPASVDMCTTQPWRVARVKTRPVSHSCHRHGEGGKHAQHQSYGFYKYYGFAGKGAKTSWASAASKFQANPLQDSS